MWTHAISQKHVGDYLWLPPLALDAGAIIFGDLGSRLRRADGSPPASLYFAALILVSAIALVPWAMSPWKATAFLSLASAGGGAMYTLSTSDMLSKLAPGIVSFAGGTLAGAQSLALIIANPLIGYVVDHRDNYDAVTIALAVCAIPGALIWMVWRPRASERLGLQV
jgi:predicted MFS family arabinose efflux permease